MAETDDYDTPDYNPLFDEADDLDFEDDWDDEDDKFEVEWIEDEYNES